MSLRIISGELKRRQLKTPRGMSTRPYTDRVRQIVFDRLGDLSGHRVADVFSGVGTMGLESLSRGAAACVFIEFDREVYTFLKENVTILAPDNTVCWRTNVHKTSFVPKGTDTCLPYSMVFFDPPYAQCELLDSKLPLGKALKRLARPNATSADATLILRTPQQVDLPHIDSWSTVDCWSFSTMKIWILRKPEFIAAEQHNQTEPENVENDR